jgi:hypothetical protein
LATAKSQLQASNEKIKIHYYKEEETKHEEHNIRVMKKSLQYY